MTDEMIRAVARKGGVVQINFHPAFLTKRKSPPASVEDVAAHIDHVVKIAGIGAVGIGSDFDGIPAVPVGIEDVSKFPNLTRALEARGYKTDQIRQIYSGNFLRFMRSVGQVADLPVAHSSRKAASGSRRAARQAGSQPAASASTTAAAALAP